MIRVYAVTTSRTGTIRKLLVGLAVGVVLGFIAGGML